MNMTHKRPNTNPDLGHGSKRFENINAKLQEVRRIYRKSPRDGYSEHIASLRRSRISSSGLEMAERNEEAHNWHELEL